jgi:lipopolysaccharide export LptBFGC system permease protein LptF
VAICIALALTVADDSVGSAIADSAVFFAVLLLVPALVGLGLGAVVHRVRSREVTPA